MGDVTPMPVPMDNSITNWNPMNTSLQRYTLEEALLRDKMRILDPAPVKNRLPIPQPPAEMGLGSSVGASSGGMGLGRAIGPASGGMPPVQNLTLSNVPQQLTLSNVPQTLTLGSTSAPQPAPTGMALGGLMRKYGGMC